VMFKCLGFHETGHLIVDCPQHFGANHYKSSLNACFVDHDPASYNKMKRHTLYTYGYLKMSPKEAPTKCYSLQKTSQSNADKEKYS